MAAENKKNESSAERRKKEEKLRQKAEKEARKVWSFEIFNNLRRKKSLPPIQAALKGT